MVQRKAASAASDLLTAPEADATALQAREPQVAGLIVGDGQVPGPDQMSRTAFLEQLRAATTRTVATILGPVWERGGCPYLEAWFARHGADDEVTLERIVRRYAGHANSAAEYIQAASTRLSHAVVRWSAGMGLTDHLDAAGLESLAMGGAPDALMAKQTPGTHAAEPGSPAAIVRQLGRGEALDGNAATRLGGVYGTSFGEVRVHTDAPAAQLASQLGARAFTVGSHVAFGAGEYRPSTLAGEALLAHELAHVAQQRSARADERALIQSPLERSVYEDDADAAAVGAMARLHGAGPAAAEALDARPQLRTELSLQRCKKPAPEPPPKRPEPKADAKELSKGTMSWNLEPSGNNSAQIQITFTPKGLEGNKTITFLQTVLYTTTSGGEATGEIIPGPKFKPATRRIDIRESEYDPFYGAMWDGTKWTEEGLSPEDTAKGYKNAPGSTKGGPAYLFDRPSVNAGERQVLEAVAVVPETGETLGALKWGLEYGRTGLDRWKLLNATKDDCTEIPSKELAPTLEQFYTLHYDAILDGFQPNDATLSASHMAQLDPIATRLKDNRNLLVRIGGFADATETDATASSAKRAQAVKNYLMKKGVAEKQAQSAAFGASWARFTPGATEARNRRVQLIVGEGSAPEPAPPDAGATGSSGPSGGSDAGLKDAGGDVGR